MPLLLLLPLLGCADECETVTADVGDDAPLGDFDVSPADVLAAIGGPHAVTLSGADGRTVDATLVVTRGEGPATLTDTTKHEGFDGLGAHDYDLFACYDEAKVPVVLDLSTSDGAFAGTAVAQASLSMLTGRGDREGVGTVSMVSWLAADAVLTPPNAGPDAADLQVTFDGDTLERVSLWWMAEGEVEHALVFASDDGERTE